VNKVTVQLEVQRKQFLAMVNAPNDRRAALDDLNTEATRIVKETTDAMAFIATNNMVSLKVCHDRRGWQIRGTLDVEDPQLKQLLLSVAKQRFMLQCQHSNHVCLLNSRTHPWKDTHYGFRALLSLVEEYDKACIPMHESGQCPHGQQCLKKHPVCVKRLYVAIHTREHFQDVDNDAGEKWEISTSKCGTLPADFVSVQNAMLSISAQGTMPNLTFLMSV